MLRKPNRSLGYTASIVLQPIQTSDFLVISVTPFDGSYRRCPLAYA